MNLPNIETPKSIQEAPAEARPIPEAVQKDLGRVPNMFLVLSNSPLGLRGYLDLRRALTKGTLSAATLERIALALAEVDDCDYCLAAGEAPYRKLDDR